MNDFDKAARYTAKLNPAGFLRWLLPRLNPTCAFRRWLDTRRLPFPGEKDRTCDTVAEFQEAKPDGGNVAVVVEFQTEPQPVMLHRLQDYLSRLNLELQNNPLTRGQFQVAGALINLTGPVFPDAIDMRLPGMEEYGMWTRVVLRTLSTEDAASTLAGIAAGTFDLCILPWISLMRCDDVLAIINQWKEVAGREQDALRRSQYAALAVSFAELADRVSDWKSRLEDWNMGESAVMNEYRMEGQRLAIRRFLQARFSQSVPDDVRALIDQQHNMDVLTSWIDAAATASSMDQFRAAVKP